VRSSADDIPAGIALERGRLRDVPPLAAWMAAEESAARSSLRTEARRRGWTLGRWVAKRAAMRLAGEPDGADPRRWAVIAAPDGAPEVFLDGVPRPVSISLSHRAGAALAAAAEHPAVVGCDLELVEPRTEAFIDDYLTRSERDYVRTAPPGPERDLRANLAWCGKEAALKVVRTGLRRDTRSMVTGLDAGGAAPGDRPEAWHPFHVEDRTDGTVLRAWWRAANGFVEVVALGSLRDA
jgi:4'-phosphopantetheinyl transferase